MPRLKAKEYRRICDALGITPMFSTEPKDHLIEAAARDLPRVIRNVHVPSHLTFEGSGVQIHPEALGVCRALQIEGHSIMAAAYAILHCIERRFLDYQFRVVPLQNDCGQSPAERFPKEVVQVTRTSPITIPTRRLYVIPTEELDRWWKSSPVPKWDERSAEDVPAKGVGLATAIRAPAPLPDGPTTTLAESRHGGIFRWRGKEYRVTGIKWRVLCVTWINRQISFADLGEEAWDDDTTEPSTIRSCVSRMNGLMLDFRINSPPIWTTSKEVVILEVPAN